MIDLYDISVIPYRQGLGVLSDMLGKASLHASERKIEPDALLNARLFPDMLPFAWQIQIASDHARRGLSRLLGIEPASQPDTERSFDELRTRVAGVQAFVDGYDRHALQAGADRTIEVKFGKDALRFAPAAYLSLFSLPNFYFHITTAYDILRHNGVTLGKRDFLGPMPANAG